MASLHDLSFLSLIICCALLLSVLPKTLQTTRSMIFMHLEKDMHFFHAHEPYHLWHRSKGEGIIIGNLDSGVWPESESFNDHGYTLIPSKWRGVCQNNTQLPVKCNRKLIGARYFNKGYLAKAKEMNVKVEDIGTARDMVGHGSHTLSTAGGNFVAGANLYGVANGTAKGSAPHARLASYKVCWKPLEKNGRHCFDEDIRKGFKKAIRDGVDVLSISLALPDSNDFSNDAIVVGAFHAVKHGIAVVASAGNYGEVKNKSVSNAAPWMLTVAASTIDRNFKASVKLGNDLLLNGISVYAKLEKNKWYLLIRGSDAKAASASISDAMHCKYGTLDSKKAKGKIVMCLLGNDIDPKEKGEEAVRAGAIGMIICNVLGKRSDLKFVERYALPSVTLTYADSKHVFHYLDSSKKQQHVAYMSPPKTYNAARNNAPSMATFSSRGPNAYVPTLLKPDITAPGVNILAANSQAEILGKKGKPFDIMSGTSMASPHVAGIVALLKSIHPDWSQAALMSAIMTTASAEDRDRFPIKDWYGDAATPFSYGSGHINPNRAVEPGLVYDATITDYLNFLCALGLNSTEMKIFNQAPYKCPESTSLDINYPSISAPKLTGPRTLTRKLKNVGKAGTYRVNVIQPKGIHVRVYPRELKFGKIGEEKSFKITLTPKKKRKYDESSDQTDVFGAMIWKYENYYTVRSPIAASVSRNA